MLNVALIVGSTRPNRFADTPTRWIVAGAAERQDFKLDVLDLREQRLPFFNEPSAPIYAEGRYSEPAAEAWRLKIGGYYAFATVRPSRVVSLVSSSKLASPRKIDSAIRRNVSRLSCQQNATDLPVSSPASPQPSS
jgi:hypothetical protein